MILSFKKSTSAIICSAAIFLCLALVSCTEKKSEVNIIYPEGWFKGNTHSHTRISDGNASPEDVVKWYHDHGYNFLALTDHNKFVNPDSIKLPENARKDFILIPGIEVTGKRVIHTTGLNVHGYIHPGFEYNSVTEVIQHQIDSIIAGSGLPILNHPNFRSGAHASQILPVKGLHMLELFNGHPSVYNWGLDDVHASVETKWDSLLTLGQKYYAVASDDVHHFDQFFPERANPGRGWVMVKSNVLSADSITAALARGDFYASNGVILETILLTGTTFTVKVDQDATTEELKSPYLTGEIVPEGKPGFAIEFIGSEGRVFQKTEGDSATFVIDSNELYTRCRVTYCRRRSENKYEMLYAWTQPVFKK